MIDEGRYAMSLREIADVLEITVEGVRKIEKRALKKIREHGSSVLLPYLTD